MDRQNNIQNIPVPTPTESVIDQPIQTQNPTPNPTPIEIQVDYNSEVQRLLNQATQKISQLRNVTVPQVPLQVVTKDWAIQTWGVSTANSDQANIQRQENIYKALMMIPQNASLYEATVSWAGYFMAVVQAGQIYIVKENFNISHTVDMEATLAHELTHILQASHNIPQYYYSFDANKARTALTEGDATFTASYIKNQTLATKTPNPQPINDIQESLIFNNLESTTFYPAMPDSVSNLNYFPYSYGEKFMQALYNRGSWEMINQAYKDPPNSTEQILHPEKYFNAELPESVDEITPSEDNWLKTWGAQYGEFFIQNMLSTNLTKAEAEKASTGWGGDKLAYFEQSENQFLITWHIKWDTYNDAGEFFLAFNNYMKNAGAQEIEFCHWQTNQIHQKIDWTPNTNTTLIVASTSPIILEQFRK